MTISKTLGLILLLVYCAIAIMYIFKDAYHEFYADGRANDVDGKTKNIQARR
jgi:hypothetical protein